MTRFKVRRLYKDVSIRGIVRGVVVRSENSYGTVMLKSLSFSVPHWSLLFCKMGPQRVSARSNELTYGKN